MSDMWRIRTVFQGASGAPWVSTQFFLAGPGTLAQSLSDLAAFWGAVDNFMKTTITWATEANVLTVDEATGQPTAVTGTTPATGTGGSAADLLPEATQVCLNLHSGLFVNGHEGRGRIFIPGFTEDQCDTAGHIAAATKASVLTAANTLINSVNSQLIIYSRVHRAIYPANAVDIGSNFALLKSRRD